MRDWFRSIGVPAEIIRVTPQEIVVEPEGADPD